MHFKAVLIDIDNTLFHFDESSYKALKKAFAAYGVDFTREMFHDYEARFAQRTRLTARCLSAARSSARGCFTSASTCISRASG